ncbi:MAG: hypothetical protein U5K54_05080 [Cytophagales bacterium]|nr:hypothetical protein [Cytophagales bacterium]
MDTTKTIEFDGNSWKDQDTNLVEATADLKIKRTDFQVMYGWKVENAMLS